MVHPFQRFSIPGHSPSSEMSLKIILVSLAALVLAVQGAAKSAATKYQDETYRDDTFETLKRRTALAAANMDEYGDDLNDGDFLRKVMRDMSNDLSFIRRTLKDLFSNELGSIRATIERLADIQAETAYASASQTRQASAVVAALGLPSGQSSPSLANLLAGSNANAGAYGPYQAPAAIPDSSSSLNDAVACLTSGLCGQGAAALSHPPNTVSQASALQQLLAGAGYKLDAAPLPAVPGYPGTSSGAYGIAGNGYRSTTGWLGNPLQQATSLGSADNAQNYAARLA